MPSISNHLPFLPTEQYKYKKKDCLVSSLTLTGFPYAKHHFKLYQTEGAANRKGHLALAVAECIPIFGGLIALIERVAAFALHHFSIKETESSSNESSNFPFWKKEFNKQWKRAPKMQFNSNIKVTYSDEKEEKLKLKKELVGKIVEPTREQILNKGYSGADAAFIRNLYKAHIENGGIESFEEYVPSAEAMNKPASSKPIITGTYTVQTEQNEDWRNSMEDEHFYKKWDGGILAGVLDGHGGDAAAKHVKEKFYQKFRDELKKSNDIRQVFQKVVDDLDADLKKLYQEKKNSAGTTVTVSYIDKKTGRIYTANLADSEAVLYRKDKNNKFLPRPLSCVRKLKSFEDAYRIARNTNGIDTDEDTKEQTKENIKNPQRIGWCLNIPRALGDHLLKGWQKNKISRKLKISEDILKVGDVVILGCDGLWDVTKKEAVSAKLNESTDPKTYLPTLVKDAKKSKDNITVMAIQIKAVK